MGARGAPRGGAGRAQGMSCPLCSIQRCSPCPPLHASGPQCSLPPQVASPTLTHSATLTDSGLTNETSWTKSCPQYPTIHTRPRGSSTSKPQRHLGCIRSPP